MEKQTQLECVSLDGEEEEQERAVCREEKNECPCAWGSSRLEEHYWGWEKWIAHVVKRGCRFLPETLTFP